MSEKHFSIFRHKNVYEVSHKSQYIRILGNHSICKSTLPGFPEGCLFPLTKDRTFSPDKETDRTLISRIGSEDAEDTQEQVDDVEVKIDCAVHCVIKCLRIHLRFAVVVADV